MPSWLQLAALLVAACAVGEVAAQCHVDCACEGTASMYCINGPRTEPPEGAWSSLKYLALDGNYIKELYDYSLKGFPALTRLTITNNYLTSLDPEPFRSLSNLRSLDLSGNHISHIGVPISVMPLTEFYLNRNKLTELDPLNVLNYWVVTNGLVELKNNPLKASPGAALINTDFLATIVLDGIDAAELSRASFEGSVIYPTTLSLKKAGVRDITGAFVDMEKLSKIWLSGNNITHVTEGSFYPGRILTELYLNDNPLQRIDVEAVNEAIPYSTSKVPCLVDISNTPLACECGYEDLYWWTEERRVELTANCKGGKVCQFDP